MHEEVSDLIFVDGPVNDTFAFLFLEFVLVGVLILKNSSQLRWVSLGMPELNRRELKIIIRKIFKANQLSKEVELKISSECLQSISK